MQEAWLRACPKICSGRVAAQKDGEESVDHRYEAKEAEFAGIAGQERTGTTSGVAASVVPVTGL
jgi:hypothetical protein